MTDAERESLEQIDLMAGEVVSVELMLAVYGGLITLIIIGVAVLWRLP